MPRFPGRAARVDALTGSVFEAFLPKMREQGANLVRLHIGDSYLPPTYPIPVDAGFLDDHPGFNRYCNTFGVYELRAALAEKLARDNGLSGDPDDVMMTAGAANALNVSALGLLDPGDEVLVLTPCWPFFRGMVRMAGAIPVEVPLYTDLYGDPDLDIAARLEAAVTDRSAAIYLNTPNNPSGKVLERRHLEQVAAVAARHNLWVISDEAYDGMVFGDLPHISFATLPGMAERTLSIFTFSKVYMFAGLRLGYAVAPNALLRDLNKVMVHQLYSPSTLGQQMMVEPVRRHGEWSGTFVAHCRELRDIICAELTISHQEPEGAYYLFFPVDEYLDGRDYDAFIAACLDAGVSIAPGRDFGEGYETWVRLCFAGESPERLRTAIERLNGVLARRR